MESLPSKRKPEGANQPSANQIANSNRTSLACQQFGHFAREYPNRENSKAYKPARQRVNQVTQPAQPAHMPRFSWSKAAATPVTSTFELVVFLSMVLKLVTSCLNAQPLRSPENKSLLLDRTMHLQPVLLKSLYPRKNRNHHVSALFLRGR